MNRWHPLVRGFSLLAFVALDALHFPGASAPLAAQQAAPSAAPPAAAQPVVDRYTYQIQLPDSGKFIQVNALAHLAAYPQVDTVEFDLDDAMHVLGVRFLCGELREDARFVRAPGQVKVAIPRARDRTAGYTPAQTNCISIAYEGVPADGLIISTDSAGRWAAFGDNFPNRARFWLASMDHPSRKARVTFEIIAPAARTVVANGALVASKTMADGRAMTTWREDRPIPTYGMVIAAAPLAAHELGKTACGLAEDGGCVPQAVWTAPEQARYMPGQFSRAGEIVEFYARTVGAYPYEKLGHLQTTTRYGGMENPSAIFYFDRAFRRANGVNDELIAHETAHQWFGDAVTEREWAHLWLSEGFATFFAALWAQHAHGDTAYAVAMMNNRAAVVRSSISASHAVIDSVEPDPNRLLNENSYQKGGLVLHMLRTSVLGDSLFFAGLRRYFAAHRHGNALTQDLQRALEETSGRTLGWFFDEWLRRPGWAELRTSWAWDRATGAVTLLVDQEGRFGPYRLAMPIEVTNAAGERITVTVEIAAERSQVIGLRGVRLDAAPASVVCDPRQTMLAVCTAK